MSRRKRPERQYFPTPHTASHHKRSELKTNRSAGITGAKGCFFVYFASLGYRDPPTSPRQVSRLRHMILETPHPPGQDAMCGGDSEGGSLKPSKRQGTKKTVFHGWNRHATTPQRSGLSFWLVIFRCSTKKTFRDALGSECDICTHVSEPEMQPASPTRATTLYDPPWLVAITNWATPTRTAVYIPRCTEYMA